MICVMRRYTRTLVGYDEQFIVLLLCWEKGQSSPIHDHAGSSCWVKILTGTLDEVPGTIVVLSISTAHIFQVLYQRGEDGSVREVAQLQTIEEMRLSPFALLGVHYPVSSSSYREHIHCKWLPNQWARS